MGDFAQIIDTVCINPVININRLIRQSFEKEHEINTVVIITDLMQQRQQFSS